MWMAILMGGVFTMENPHGSLVAMHPRYSWMVKRLLEVGIQVARWPWPRDSGGVGKFLCWKLDLELSSWDLIIY